MLLIFVRFSLSNWKSWSRFFKMKTNLLCLYLTFHHLNRLAVFCVRPFYSLGVLSQLRYVESYFYFLKQFLFLEAIII